MLSQLWVSSEFSFTSKAQRCSPQTWEQICTNIKRTRALPSAFRFRLGEEADDAGETVDERFLADRADFAVAEEAGGGDRADLSNSAIQLFSNNTIHLNLPADTLHYYVSSFSEQSDMMYR